MATDQVSVEITVEEKQALKALTALTKSVDKFENETTKSVKKVDGAFTSFKGNLAAIATSGAITAIGSGLKSLVVDSIDAAAATEKIRTQLEVLTGSQEKAANLYAQLTEYSAGTPFQLQGIAEASAQLISFGFEAETVQERISRIGEVAAGSGSDLKEVALIYGQVAAAGKLTGERLLQFQERAIPIGAALADSLGVAESQVKDLVSQGVVGFKDFEKAFNSLSQSGGLFEGAVKKQSETINGVISTLKDNFFLLQSEIGNAFAPSLIDGAKIITSSLQELTKVLVENKSSIETGIKFVADYVDVYANLAGSLVKTKTPLDEINAKIEENVNKTQDLIERKGELEESKGSFFGIFDKNTQLSIEKVNGMLATQDGQLKELIKRRKELIGANRDPQSAETNQENTPDQSPRVNAEDNANAQILQKRRDFQANIALLEEEKKIKEQETILANTELEEQQRVEALQRLQTYQDQKAQIEYNSQVEKNKLIHDARSRELANEAASIKLSIAQQQNRAKTEQQIAILRQNTIDKQVSGFGRATAMASAIAKKGTAEQKALATSSAIINTYAASTRAFRDYPYPANIAVMATTIAAGLKQVSEIQKQSFATGGVVGGYNGASMGMDNTTINARQGEMVLNANQQRTLFDIANKNANEPQGSQVIELTTVVQIDEREIARAVRNERINGFAS